MLTTKNQAYKRAQSTIEAVADYLLTVPANRASIALINVVCQQPHWHNDFTWGFDYEHGGDRYYSVSYSAYRAQVELSDHNGLLPDHCY